MQINFTRIIPKIVKILITILFVANIFQVRSQLQDSSKLQRIRYIESVMQKDLSKTKWWWNGWLYGYGGATLVQGIVYFNSDEKTVRQDMALGAATTFLGVIGQFLTPLKPGKELDSLSKYNEGTLELQDKKLKMAEKLFADVAEREKIARGWQNHAITGAVNLTSGLITWLGFNRTAKDGFINFALNTVITEAQIWSQPVFAMRKYKQYNTQFLQTESAKTFTPKAQCVFTAYANGFSVRIKF